MHDGVGDTSQEETGQSLASMGGHDHQVHPLRFLFDHRCGIACGDFRAYRIVRVQEFAGG